MAEALFGFLDLVIGGWISNLSSSSSRSRLRFFSLCSFLCFFFLCFSFFRFLSFLCRRSLSSLSLLDPLLLLEPDLPPIAPSGVRYRAVGQGIRAVGGIRTSG